MHAVQLYCHSILYAGVMCQLWMFPFDAHNMQMLDAMVLPLGNIQLIGTQHVCLYVHPTIELSHAPRTQASRLACFLMHSIGLLVQLSGRGFRGLSDHKFMMIPAHTRIFRLGNSC